MQLNDIKNAVVSGLHKRLVGLEAVSESSTARLEGIESKPSTIDLGVELVKWIMQSLGIPEGKISPDSAKVHEDLQSCSNGKTSYELAEGFKSAPYTCECSQMTWQERQGKLQPGQPTVEISSSNQSIGLLSSGAEDWTPHTILGSRQITSSDITQANFCACFWGSEPIIISNDPPEAHERVELLKFQAFDLQHGLLHLSTALIDTGADFNVSSVGFAEKCGSLIDRSGTRLRPLRPFGPCDCDPEHCIHKIMPEYSFWLPVAIPNIRKLVLMEFYAFEDSAMREYDCIFSVKACVKAGLILVGVTN